MEKALKTMIENIKKNTGKSLEHWVEVVLGSGLIKHGERLKFLKTEHGFTHGFANLVVHKSKEKEEGESSETDLVALQYEKKANLKPIYDKLIEAVKAFGVDVEIAPKKAYVSLRRKKQFALLQPSTKSRLDIGLNIKGKEAEGKLELSGSFNSMCSHRVRITDLEEVDQETIAWLKEAYDSAG